VKNDTLPTRRKPASNDLEWAETYLPDLVAHDHLDALENAFAQVEFPTANLLHEVKSAAMVDLLVRNGADVNQVYSENEHTAYTPLQAAIFNGNKEVFDRLLTHDPDFEIGGEQRPLMMALGHDPDIGMSGERDVDEATMIGMANALLDRGARVHAEQGEMPPLLAAVDQGHQESMIKRLLEAGADAGAVDPVTGRTALHSVCEEPCDPQSPHAVTSCANALLDYGAKVDALDNDGNPPLASAALLDNAPLADLLLKRGADPCLAMAAPMLQGADRNPTFVKVHTAAVEQEKHTLRQAAAEATQEQEQAPAPRKIRQRM